MKFSLSAIMLLSTALAAPTPTTDLEKRQEDSDAFITGGYGSYGLGGMLGGGYYGRGYYGGGFGGGRFGRGWGYQQESELVEK
jgi:hypothetical protein